MKFNDLTYNEIRNIISKYPYLYYFFKKKSDFDVSKDTDIVIEGFPRSGNSFAEAAFRISQSANIKIAHHCHSISQIKKAVKFSLPILVLYRYPIDAIASYILYYDRYTTIGQAIRRYNDFYNDIKKYKDKILLASFKTLTIDFGEIIKSINKKFDTSFTNYNHDNINIIKTYKLIDELTKKRIGVERTEYSPFNDSQKLIDREMIKKSIKYHIKNNKNIKKSIIIYKELEFLKNC